MQLLQFTREGNAHNGKNYDPQIRTKEEVMDRLAILEGVFYVLACSWAFAELKKMEGNAKIIKFIARDENVHLASTQQLMKLLPQDDKDFVQIKQECEPLVVKMFEDAVEQECAWADYLFRDGSMIGLNAQLLKEYVRWIANKRMTAVGALAVTKVRGPPDTKMDCRWRCTGYPGTEITSYVNGEQKQDVDKNSFE